MYLLTYLLIIWSCRWATAHLHQIWRRPTPRRSVCHLRIRCITCTSTDDIHTSLRAGQTGVVGGLRADHTIINSALYTDVGRRCDDAISSALITEAKLRRDNDVSVHVTSSESLITRHMCPRDSDVENNSAQTAQVEHSIVWGETRRQFVVRRYIWLLSV